MLALALFLTTVFQATIVCSGSSAFKLRDDPILTDAGFEYLDGKWQLKSKGSATVIKGTIPGDLLTDLENANIIDDPLFDLNFRNQADYWKNKIWTYSLTVYPTKSANYGFLVFDGIKMGAHIYVDDKLKETATDQFLRYIIPIGATSTQKPIQIRVEFDPSIDENGRFMACSGGWDWAPYTNVFKGTSYVMTQGIWKSVYLAYSSSGVAITALVPQIMLTSPQAAVKPFCTSTSQSNCDPSWKFDTTLRVFAFSQVTADSTTVQLSLTTDWSEIASSKTITVPPLEEAMVEMRPTVSTVGLSSGVKLWWPTRLGTQSFHSVTLCMAAATSCQKVRIGFRAASLVTGFDSHASYVSNSLNAQGSSIDTYYYRINGRIVHARGANMIPMDEMEGRYSQSALSRLLQNAVDGNFNILRIWGGGIFFPKHFYDTCDEKGILIFHDMMYAQIGHSPTATLTQEKEIKHQIRRLSPHPSIVVWNACNECKVVPNTPTEIYVSFVLKQVIAEDISRAIWPSSPSNGWKAGVHRLTSLPIGRNAKLVVLQKSNHPIEVHGPYRHGTQVNKSLAFVNEYLVDKLFTPKGAVDTSGPRKYGTGPGLQSIAQSEFGTVSMSSYESTAPTLSKAYHSIHGGMPLDTCELTGTPMNNCSGNNPLSQRNYPCDSIIHAFFGEQVNLDLIGEVAFRSQLYLCGLGSALNQKGVIELMRVQNHFELMIWQYGEIWPTGGWGTIEYGSERAGQVVGGRWKLIHHWLSDYLFADVTAACGRQNWCYIRDDSGSTARSVTYTIHDIDIKNPKLPVQVKAQGSAVLNPFVSNIFQLPLTGSVSPTGTLRVISVYDKATSALLVTNENIFTEPKGYPRLVANSSTPLTVSVGNYNTEVKGYEININGGDAINYFVQLTTLAQGRFSRNGFTFFNKKGRGLVEAYLSTASSKPTQTAVYFLPFSSGQSQKKALIDTIRITHMFQALDNLPLHNMNSKKHQT